MDKEKLARAMLQTYHENTYKPKSRKGTAAYYYQITLEKIDKQLDEIIRLYESYFEPAPIQHSCSKK